MITHVIFQFLRPLHHAECISSRINLLFSLSSMSYTFVPPDSRSLTSGDGIISEVLHGYLCTIPNILAIGTDTKMS